MKMNEAGIEMNFRAAEALKSVLSQVSTLKLKEIRRASSVCGGENGFVARVDVLGHSHTLACEVKANTDPRNLRDVLRELQQSAAHLAGDAMLVFIAPYLSPEEQAMCKECSAAYLDLEGNARIAIGEVFIGKRTFAHRHVNPPTVGQAIDTPRSVHRGSRASLSPAVVAMA
jgi:hypothetical protein